MRRPVRGLGGLCWLALYLGGTLCGSAWWEFGFGPGPDPPKWFRLLFAWLLALIVTLPVVLLVRWRTSRVNKALSEE